MGNKVMSAEELMYDKFDNDCLFSEFYDEKRIINLMKEFAKIHVKSALESAAENAEIEIDHTWVNKQSILNSYPDDNIR